MQATLSRSINVMVSSSDHAIGASFPGAACGLILVLSSHGPPLRSVANAPCAARKYENCERLLVAEQQSANACCEAATAGCDRKRSAARDQCAPLSGSST